MTTNNLDFIQYSFLWFMKHRKGWAYAAFKVWQERWFPWKNNKMKVGTVDKFDHSLLLFFGLTFISSQSRENLTIFPNNFCFSDTWEPFIITIHYIFQPFFFSLEWPMKMSRKNMVIWNNLHRLTDIHVLLMSWSELNGQMKTCADSNHKCNQQRI